MWSNLFANLTVVGSIHAIPPTATGVTPGSNVFVFSNAAGQSMVMDSSGNVGIGTTNPTSTLQVTGNVYVSNSVTTTNVFATQYTGSLSGYNQYFTRNLGNPTTSFYVLLKNTGTSGSVIGRIFGRRFNSAVRTGNISEVVVEMTTGGLANYSLRATSSNTQQTSELVSVVYNTATYIALYVYTGSLSDYASIFFEGYETTPNNDILLTTSVTSSNPLPASQSNYYILNSAVGIGTNDPGATLEVTGNIYASNAVTTTNVFATTANVGVMNVWQVSNLSSLSLTNNLYAANAITTMNLFATGNTSSISNMVIRSFDFVVAATAGSYSNVCSIIDVPNGSAIYAIYVDMMARGAGGTAQTKTYIIVSNYNATSGTWTRALPIGNPAAGGQTGLDVMTLNGTTTLRVTNRNAAETVNIGMVVKVSSSSFSRVAITDLTSQTGTGATSSGFYPTTLVTQVANRVGVSIEQPTANLHVVGNVYVSNAVTATNVFATAGAGIGPSVLGTNVFVFSNTSGGSNVLIMNNLGRVGIATTIPGYPLDVGTTVSIAASGNETIRSKGPVIIGNGTNDGNRFISALDSSMTTGDSRYFVLGKAGSIYNQAELSYTHDTDGSTNNKLILGFFSKSVMSILASGNIGVGTTTPSATVHVIGNVYASNAVTTTNVFAATVSPTNPISFRNRVINGDFLVDQRNSGASSTPTVDPTRTIDRWKVNIIGSGRCLVGQNLGAFAYPAGFTSYYGMKVTTTSTPGANDYFFLSQVVEGVNTIDWQWGTANAKTVTLSFWVFSSIAGTAGGFVRNAGSSASNYSRSYPFTFTITNTLTWEYKTVTIPGDTGTPWYTTQTDGVEFGIELWNGSTYQASPGAWASGNFTGPSGGTINYAGTLNSVMNITGVQIELGSVATQFERRHYNYELAACQRYYEPTIARLGGYHTTGGYLRSSVYFNTKKRPAASPTFTVISTPESNNLGSLNLDNSNFDGSSARILAQVTTTGDAFGQWSVSVDCEF